VVSAIYNTPKREGFQFLEVTEEKGWKEKTYNSGMAHVGLQMKHVCREKEGEGMIKICTPNSPMHTVIMLLVLGSLFEDQNLYTK
jgi:hypothetical protein